VEEVEESILISNRIQAVADHTTTTVMTEEEEVEEEEEVVVVAEEEEDTVIGVEIQMQQPPLEEEEEEAMMAVGICPLMQKGHLVAGHFRQLSFLQATLTLLLLLWAQVDRWKKAMKIWTHLRNRCLIRQSRCLLKPLLAQQKR